VRENLNKPKQTQTSPNKPKQAQTNPNKPKQTQTNANKPKQMQTNQAGRRDRVPPHILLVRRRRCADPTLREWERGILKCGCMSLYWERARRAWN
jgi:hypothetical protein